MSRYRVEVDHTHTYRVTVEADTVEEAIAAAQHRIYLNTDLHYETIAHRTVATDAQEIVS